MDWTRPTDDNLRALFGDAYEDTTAEQRDVLTRAAAAIDVRWPEPDLEGTRRDALNEALSIVLGHSVLEDVAARWHAARAAERQAHAALTGALIACSGRALQVRDGRGGGVIYTGSEVELARRAQITRMTVRKALGKGTVGPA